MSAFIPFLYRDSCTSSVIFFDTCMIIIQLIKCFFVALYVSQFVWPLVFCINHCHFISQCLVWSYSCGTSFCFLSGLLWYILSASVGSHHQLLPSVFLVQSCSGDVCVLCLCSYLTFLHLCFLCGFVLIATLLWTDPVQVCFLILTICWRILSSMYCSLQESVAASFLKIATKGLWPIIILTPLAKQ